MQQHDAKKQLGNYRMLRLLGQGGSACVYLGEHVYLKTLVAVKILQEKMGTADVESFLKEAQTIASLKHPHILRVLDFGMESSHTIPSDGIYPRRYITIEAPSRL